MSGVYYGLCSIVLIGSAFVVAILPRFAASPMLLLPISLLAGTAFGFSRLGLSIWAVGRPRLRSGAAILVAGLAGASWAVWNQQWVDLLWNVMMMLSGLVFLWISLHNRPTVASLGRGNGPVKPPLTRRSHP